MNPFKKAIAIYRRSNIVRNITDSALFALFALTLAQFGDPHGNMLQRLLAPAESMLGAEGAALIGKFAIVWLVLFISVTLTRVIAGSYKRMRADIDAADKS